MDCPPIFTLPHTRTGKTWDVISEGSLSSDGPAFADDLASLAMEFKDSLGAVVLTLPRAGGHIIIVDASAWTFSVTAITPFTLAVGHYSWEIETTDSGGSIKGYFQGELQVKD